MTLVMKGPLTIGADPEVFVRRGRHWISGHVFDCGTKRNPMVTPNGSVQVDGVALECNVRPSSDADSFVQNLRLVMGDLNVIVKNLDEDCELVARPSIFLGQRFLSGLPDEAKALGCSPDWNAYTGRTNPRPDHESPIRTGSGHIHLGWTDNENPRSVSHVETCREIARELDYTLGLPSLSFDKDSRRRSLYGRAGAFRPKPYGMEYRTLSNYWLAGEHLVKRVFRGAVEGFENAGTEHSVYSRYGDLAAEIINNSIFNWREVIPELSKELEA